MEMIPKPQQAFLQQVRKTGGITTLPTYISREFSWDTANVRSSTLCCMQLACFVLACRGISNSSSSHRDPDTAWWGYQALSNAYGSWGHCCSTSPLDYLAFDILASGGRACGIFPSPCVLLKAKAAEVSPPASSILLSVGEQKCWTCQLGTLASGGAWVLCFAYNLKQQTFFSGVLYLLELVRGKIQAFPFFLQILI